MAGAHPLSVAFIGFGEVGQTFARGFSAHGLSTGRAVALAAYDIVFGQNPPVSAELRAGALGVRVARSGRDAAAGADIILSAVTADAVEAVAREAAGWIAPGQAFLDVNSAAPETKKRAAGLINAAGGHYVEAAMMAPVLKPGLAVPILAGGPQAETLARQLNAHGMNMTPVATEYGRASAMKLSRSIIIKGLEALMLDCAASCAHWGVEKEVFASLAGTFPSIDWPALSVDMQERVATHGVRRSAEMVEAADMVRDSGRDAALIAAVAAAHLRGARPKS